MNLYSVCFGYKAEYKLVRHMTVFDDILYKIFGYKSLYDNDMRISGEKVYESLKYVLANSYDEARKIAYTEEEYDYYSRFSRDEMMRNKYYSSDGYYKYIKSNHEQISVDAIKIRFPLPGSRFINIARQIDREYFHDFLRLCIEYRNDEKGEE